MSNNTIRPKMGRPAGVKSGSGKGSGRKKMMFGLYDEDRQRLDALSALYDLSYAGVIRLALVSLAMGEGIMRNVTAQELERITDVGADYVQQYLEAIRAD